MISQAAQLRLMADEGNRQFVYDDATGQEIVPGYTVQGNPTIGVGRNVGPSGPGLSRAERANLFAGDLDRVASELDAALPGWESFPQVAQDVCQMVAFNCGIDGFLTFRLMIAAMQAGNLDDAAHELMDSAAARELPLRYGRMAAALRRGGWL